MKDHTDIHPDKCQEVRLSLNWKHRNGRVRRTPLAIVKCPHCGVLGEGEISPMQALESEHRQAGWDEFLKQNPDWVPVSRSIKDMYPGLRL